MTKREQLDKFVASNFLGIGKVVSIKWDEEHQQTTVTDAKGDHLTFEVRDNRIYCLDLQRFEATISTNWGGNRSGSGRPKIDRPERKAHSFYCDEAEFEKLKSYLDTLRKELNYKGR
jgi:hypothetical protein